VHFLKHGQWPYCLLHSQEWLCYQRSAAAHLICRGEQSSPLPERCSALYKQAAERRQNVAHGVSHGILRAKNKQALGGATEIIGGAVGNHPGASAPPLLIQEGSS